MNLECPSCHRVDSVQKVSAIVSSGTTYGTYSGFANGAGYTAHGQIMVNDYVMVSGSNQTELSRWLAPPQRPPSASLTEMIFSPQGLVISIVLLLFGLSMGYFVVGMTLLDWQFLFSFSGFVMALIAVSPVLAFLRAWYIARSRRIRAEILLPQWQIAISRWQQLYYCHRCDGVFLSGQTFLVPKEQKMSLLYAG
ncbi:MAG TPA: hypothetical protein VNE61_05965 [Ktedonobacteraceae bacterium]|nr:hypothetical protein [Ktedonobacteraceae bacterium]